MGSSTEDESASAAGVLWYPDRPHDEWVNDEDSVLQKLRARWRPVDALSSALPMIYISQLIGLVSCRVKHVNGSVTLVVSRLGAVYSAVIVIVLIVALKLNIDHLKTEKADTDKLGSVQKATILFRNISETITVLCFMFVGFKQKNMILFFKYLQEIDITMKDIHLRVPHSKNQYFVIASIVITFLSTLSLYLLDEFLSAVNEPVIVRIAYYLQFFITQMSEYGFMFCVFALRQRFSLINEHLQTQGRKADVVLLRTLSSIHWMLCDAARVLNDLFSLSFLIVIGAYFLQILTLVFEGISSLGNQKPDRSIIYGVVINVYQLSTLCLVCNIARSESERTRDTVTRILSTTTNQKMQTELTVLSITLINKKIDFTAGGFFSMDLDLLYSMGGAITTYLIVLLNVPAEEKTESATEIST